MISLGNTIVKKKNRMNALSHINEITLPYANEKWEKSVFTCMSVKARTGLKTYIGLYLFCGVTGLR